MSPALPSSLQPCSGGFDRNAQPFRGLADARIETQQPEADNRGARDEQRCEVDRIDCPNRFTWKRLARPIDYLAGNSQHVPMSSSRAEVRSTVGGFGLRQFLDRHRSEQHPITLNQGEVGCDNNFSLAE